MPKKFWTLCALTALLASLLLTGCGSSRSSSPSSSSSTNSTSDSSVSSDTTASASSNRGATYDNDNYDDTSDETDTSSESESESDTHSASDSGDDSEASSEYEENVEEVSEAEVDEGMSEEELRRLVALARRLQSQQQAQSADQARKAACHNALARLNAHLSNTAAVLGDSNTYYFWETGFRQLQVEVNTKCKAAPGEATIHPYSGSGTSGGSLNGYAAGVETRIQQQRMADRVQRAEELRRENAIRAGEYDPNPYGGRP